MNVVDKFLNSITMYRLVLYGLLTLSIISIIFGFLGILPYSGSQFLFLLLVILTSSTVFHIGIVKIAKSTPNIESFAITALILFFLLSPITQAGDLQIVILASFFAVASKYTLAINKKHIFNPAAVAVFLIGLFGFGNTIWWVGSEVLLPFVLILGLAVVRKIRKFHLFFAFVISSLVTTSLFGVSLSDTITSWPLIFFGTIMLTEPLTTPHTKKLTLIYGVIVGLIFGSQFSFGPIYASPELALVIGNIFSYLVSPKSKLFLKLKNKTQLATNIYEFVFTKPRNFHFTPGQYLEWTLNTKKTDGRGNRRYFTIASSPTETDLKLGIKIAEQNSSSFKLDLVKLKEGGEIVASQLAGEFLLPHDREVKLVFVAGGIGVTPFRSMIKYLLDTNEVRDIVFFYASASDDEFVYGDIFTEAEEKLGIKVIYVNTTRDGYITEDVIKKHVGDYKMRKYYLSGPNAMVENYEKLVKNLGVPRQHIVKDYFPGF